MYVHTFGAYFGCAASYFFMPKKAIEDKDKRCEGSYNSQLIAMVGTIFLWMFWPSFNGALASESQQQRVIVNTVMAISASCVSACALSRLMLQRLNMEVVLNATLAGGVSALEAAGRSSHCQHHHGWDSRCVLARLGPRPAPLVACPAPRR